MSHPLIHSIILILTISFSFLLVKTSFYQYELQITALLFFVYFVAKKIWKKIPLLDSVVFTLIILNIINSTGGTTSPLFFLTYFLIFALSLLIEPVISITTTLTLVVFYLLTSSYQSTKELLAIFSLPFLTPFAIFLGKEQVKNAKLKSQNAKLKEQSFLFLSLVIKNHLKSIREAVENFMGDHELEKIKKNARRVEELIDRYERSSN